MNDEIINGDLEPNTPPLPAEPSPCPVDADSVPAAPEFEGFPAVDPQAARIRELEAEVLKFKCDLDWVADESKEYREKWKRQCRLSMERLEEMRRLEAENARLVAIYAELREAVAGQSATLKRQANSTMLHTVAGEDVAALTALRLDEILTGKYKGIEEIDWLPAQSVVDELATVTARESALREAVAGLADEWREEFQNYKDREGFVLVRALMDGFADQLDAIVKGAGE